MGREKLPDLIETLDALGRSGGLLAGLLELISADWQAYRRQPDSRNLDRLGRSLEAALSCLSAFEVLHEGSERRGDSGVTPPQAEASPSAPRPGRVDPPRMDPDRSPTDLARPAGRRARDAAESEIPFPPYRDQATGLHSREGFDAAASGELKRCRRHERPFALLLLQLDIAGPDALRRSAAVIRGTLRESDLVGRHIDRTFAVALPEGGLAEARTAARRLIRALDRTGSWTNGRIGLASHPIDGETLLALLEVARGQMARPVVDVLGEPDAWTAADGDPRASHA